MKMLDRTDLLLVMVGWDKEDGVSTDTAPVIGWNDALEPVVLYYGVPRPYATVGGGSELGQVVVDRGVVSLDLVVTGKGLDESIAAAVKRVMTVVDTMKEKVNG